MGIGPDRKMYTIQELLDHSDTSYGVPRLIYTAAQHNLIDKLEDLYHNHDAIKFINVKQHSIDMLNRDGIEPPLHTAIRFNQISAVQWLLSHGADPNSEQELANGDAFPALFMASQIGNVRIASLLLQAGADIHGVKKSKQTPPIYIAVQNEYAMLVTLLLQNGANPMQPTTMKFGGIFSPLVSC